MNARDEFKALLAQVDALTGTNEMESTTIAGMREQLQNALSLLTPEAEIVELPRAGKVVRVPAGDFLYGPNKAKRTIEKDYYIQLTTVTVGQFEEFCRDAGWKMPDAPSWGWDNKDFPMVNITWWQAVAYAQWSGGFLPTEEQWERAARGTDGRLYPWGDNWDASKCINSVERTRSCPEVVTSCPEGRSPVGCYNMSGNVWEWCANPEDATTFAKQMGL
jgi:formylglycine-generating enzyme required for sulfatase activity